MIHASEESEMSKTNTSDWMKLNWGDPVCRKDDPRHTGRVTKIENSSDVTIKWDGTGWFSAEPLADI
jgi:hypothetical protein